MDATKFGTVIGIVVLVAAVAIGLLKAGVLGKQKLPPLPEWGPLPLADLSKYYAVAEQPIAWEKVRGWDLNQVPPGLTAPGPVDHIVLLPRLLEFCSGASGRLVLVFNFLVEAIQQVQFNPQALPVGSAPPGYGLVTVHTPSGQTLLIASPAFAQALEQAVARAQRSG